MKKRPAKPRARRAERLRLRLSAELALDARNADPELALAGRLTVAAEAIAQAKAVPPGASAAALAALIAFRDAARSAWDRRKPNVIAARLAYLMRERAQSPKDEHAVQAAIEELGLIATPRRRARPSGIARARA